MPSFCLGFVEGCSFVKGCFLESLGIELSSLVIETQLDRPPALGGGLDYDSLLSLVLAAFGSFSELGLFVLEGF